MDILKYRPIVISVCNRYKDRSNYTRDDLEQEGNIALMEALRRYQEGRKAKFTTFAYAHIKNRISRFVKQNYYFARVPEGIFKSYYNTQLQDSKISKAYLPSLWLNKCLDDKLDLDRKEDDNISLIDKLVLEEFLNGLMPRDRIIFIKYFGEGYTEKEIAMQLCISRQVISRRIGHIKKMVKYGR